MKYAKFCIMQIQVVCEVTPCPVGILGPEYEDTAIPWNVANYLIFDTSLKPLMPNDHYSGHTAPLTSKRCILHIYSTNIGTEYFKHDMYSPLFSLQNAVSFIILTYLVPILFTFYIQDVLKLKK
jgi:hypothetical protein